MQWSNSLKSDVLKCGTSFVIQIDFDEIVESVLLYAYTGHSPVSIKLMPIISGNDYYLETESSVMIPIPSGTNVNDLKISRTNVDWETYGMYEIILEGDEIKEFPNGGALVIENIRINFNFE